MTSSNLMAAWFMALTAAAPALLAQAPITLVVLDPPGVGFNDPTPAAPV